MLGAGAGWVLGRPKVDATTSLKRDRGKRSHASRHGGSDGGGGDGVNHKQDTDTQVFFYEQEFYVLSNFSAFNMYWHGQRFDTAEHVYHWEKFSRHPAIQQQIRNALSAHDAFKIAEKNKVHRRPDWDVVKVEIMTGILRAKVAQHEYVRRKLLETGSRKLFEDSWRDDFWGWGSDQTGQNVLGKLWTQIRQELCSKPAAHQRLKSAEEG